MNITPQEADTLFDTSLAVLNNVDNVTEFDGHIRLTVPREEYEAFSDAVAACIKAQHREFRLRA